MYIARLLPLSTVTFASAAGSRRRPHSHHHSKSRRSRRQNQNLPKRSLFQRFAQPALILSVLSSGLSSDQARTRTVPKKPPTTALSQPETNRTDWSDVRALNPQGTLEDYDLFSNLFRYCKDKGIDLEEAIDVASKIRPTSSANSLTPGEKAHALMIAVILLEIQKDTTNSFYARAEYKDFIDTVLKNIRAGKLKITDKRAKRQRNVSEYVEYYFARYDTMSIISPLNKISMPQKLPLLHELFHFFQDIQGKRISRTKTEWDAYLMNGDYFLISAGLDRKTTNAYEIGNLFRKTFGIPINRDFSALVLKPLQLAIWASYAKQRGDKKEYNKLLKLFETFSERDAVDLNVWVNGTSPEFIAAQNNLFRSALAHVRTSPGKSRFLKQLEQWTKNFHKLKNKRLKAFKELINRKSFDHGEASSRFGRVIIAWLAIINFALVTDLVKRDKSGAELQRALNSRLFNRALVDRLYKQMYDELLPLHYAKIVSPIDGVK